MKVYIEPNPGKRPDRADGGIRRVIDAQIKYLPQFGVKVTRKLEDADLTAGHVDHMPLAQGKPFVSHNHGLMWSEYFDSDSDREVNQNVVQAMLQADAITCPSQWVRGALVRGMLRSPHVIYHGVDTDDWSVPATHGNYVLWNKARADAVSNPEDLVQLAKAMPQTKFVSTIGAVAKNVQICGVVPYPQMKTLIQNAGVYLATARETFGIGTLEALACGVPVAGWDYGGQSEIIVQGETGYLAPYGDYNALAECVNKCLVDRARLSANARNDALVRWQWKDKIRQYAELYQAVLDDWNKPRPKVSVIVPCHNLAKYLPDALKSVQVQTLNDWECVIVDDASTDHTPIVASDFVVADKWGLRFKYVKTPENLKLSRALNFGHAHAQGKYIIHLDADNVLPENALEILSDALDKRRDLHIAYGALDTISDDGTNRQRNAFPFPVYQNYSWYQQMAHLNQLHSGAMMRREVVMQSGGYRERQWRAEDSEFWARVTSFGFRAERVTEQPTLIYRWRVNSKSMIERRENADIDGNWLEYLPWSTATNYKDGEKVKPETVKYPQLVPFGAQGKRHDKLFWDVSHHQAPLVSVIIPVGLGHQRFVIDALDSLIGQTVSEWEAIVVNDTGEPWDSVAGAPYAKVFATSGKCGAGAARNLGLAKAQGKLVVFLDADDMLKPNALLKMTQRYAVGDVGYVYCDALVPESQNQARVHEAGEFTQAFWSKNWLHSQTVLMSKTDAIKIGFDESLPAHEDLDFFIRCVINGVCGGYVPEPLLLYRKHLGQRSAFGFDHKLELFKVLQAKYQDYRTGAKSMAKCGSCGDKKVMGAIAQSKVMQMKVESLDKPLAPGFVRIKYTGAKMAPISFYAHRKGYPFCATPKYKIQDIPAEDAEILLSYAHFERVRVVPQVVPAPQILEPVATVAPVQPVAQVSAPVAPIAQALPVPATLSPKPAPPLVDVERMQAAVKAMEEATGKPIQPAPKVEAKPIPPLNESTQPETVVTTTKKRGYKGKRK